MRVLFASSEVYPFAKSGGLADVSFGLPKALSQKCDVDIIMPLYGFIDKKRYHILSTGRVFTVAWGRKSYELEIFQATYEGIVCYFVYTPVLSCKKSLYGTASRGYVDNDLRFGLFCKGVLAWMQQGDTSYDTLHLNDWQTALCALWAKEEKRDLSVVYTIHNLAYQGVFEKESLKRLGLDPKRYDHMESMEFYGNISFMKAGIAYADAVTTVSPGYAKEILTPRFGAGLEGFLQRHQKKLTGILNGIDLSHFSPLSDTALVANYESESYEKKALNKEAFIREQGLPEGAKPLLIFIGRFTWQKGIDLLVSALSQIAPMDINIAVLGDGETQYHQKIAKLSRQHKNIDVVYGYDESRAHRMYAAADFLLMPSLFEPCGLNQLIGMHYGLIPIVHYVGGLKDSVHPVEEFDAKNAIGYGIGFEEPDAKAFVEAVKKALKLYRRKDAFETICRHNMRCDFSWSSGAQAYEALYRSLKKVDQ